MALLPTSKQLAMYRQLLHTDGAATAFVVLRYKQTRNNTNEYL
jgi:hypothetical protein